MYKFQTGFRRCLCALLCLMLTGAALAEPLPDGTTTFAEQAGETPTPTPTQTPTPAADPTPTPAPSQTPGELPTPTAAPSESPTPTAAPSESPTPTAAPSESPTPTAAPSESPTPTAAPSESPTPTAAPSESPTPTATPSQTPAPSAWDESLCDHTTENCEQAPECTVPGCKHIGVNELGEVVALCDLGQWLFDAADRAAASAMLMRASSARTEVALENGENILYRSGSYTLTGGGENASLYVRQGLAISLWFSDARLLTLNLNSGVAATLGFSGVNTLSTLAASAAHVVIDGTGSLSVQNNLNCASLTVYSGNVSLPSGATSTNGYQPYRFSAAGARRVTLEGQSYGELCADAQGNVCVWLPAPQSGLTYRAALNGDSLDITALSPAPAPDDQVDLSESAVFQAQPNKSYTLVASSPDSQDRVINGAAGASFTLAGIGTASSAPTFQGNGGTLYLSGDNHILALSAPYALSGSGRLYIQSLTASDLTAHGALTVCVQTGSPPASWIEVQVTGGEMSPDITASFGGSDWPALYLTGQPQKLYAPLPAPETGMRYEGVIEGGRVTLSAVPVQAETLVVPPEGLTLGSGDFRLAGASEGSLTFSDGCNATLTLSGFEGNGGLNVGANANLHLVLESANRLGAIALGEGATLTVSGPGALSAQSVAGGSVSIGETVNLGLASGALPGSLTPTRIRVTGDNDQPLASAGIQLRLGTADPFDVTTDANGLVTLWRDTALDGASVVVLYGKETYAGVAVSGEVSPGALPTLQSVAVSDKGEVSLSAQGAGTLALMYRVSKQREELPDTWVDGASLLYLTGGKGQIPNLQPGDVVTYRAVAAAQTGVSLNALTADAFAFGDRGSVTIASKRVRFALDTQYKTFNREPFVLRASLLPAGSTVAYYDGNQALKDGPCLPGEYTAVVTVPEGDLTYLPGESRVTLVVKPIVVTIYPDENMKQKDDPDPELTFTYDESVMLEGDEVTGVLTREPGEAYGNYAYLLDRLVVPEGYELVLDPMSPLFFIDWNIHHYLPYDPFARIDPIYDELLFSDGKTLRTQIRTNELLKVGDVYYGRPVTDLIDGKERPVTPSLRLRGGYDSALLILNAEAEFAKDGGYETDLDGNRVYRGRRLTLTYSMMANLRDQRIDYVAFGLNGVCVLVRLEDLQQGENLARLMEENGVRRLGTVFHIDLEPVDALADNEASAADALRLGEKLMRVSVCLQNGDTRLDISSTLSDALVLFDATSLLGQAQTVSVSDQSETVNGRVVVNPADEQAQLEAAAIAGAKGETATTQELTEVAQDLLSRRIEQTGATLAYYGPERTLLLCDAVTPYTESEQSVVPYTALMRTSPYLCAPFAVNGLYGLTEP